MGTLSRGRPPCNGEITSLPGAHHALHLTCVLLLVGACSDAELGSTARGSAADRRAELVQELRIDGHSHDLVPFDGQSSGAIAVARDGTIAINQPQDRTVRFFGPTGEPLGRFGGEGAGPGEFRRPVQLGWLGDSLWIHDTGLNRLTLLTPGRELARTVALTPGARPPATQRGSVPESEFAAPVGVLPGGRIVSHVLPYGDRSPEAFRQHTFFAVLTHEGLITEVLARVPAGEPAVMADGGSASIPFANRTVQAVSRDASIVAFARATTEADDPGVTVHLADEQGETILRRTYPIDLVPLPGAVRDSALEHLASRLSSSRSLADAARSAASRIAVYPPLQDLIVGRDGTVWIALANREGEKPYLVLDAGGDPLGYVHVGARSRIAEAERERIWVIEKDEVDVESLNRYGVQW